MRPLPFFFVFRGVCVCEKCLRRSTCENILANGRNGFRAHDAASNRAWIGTQTSAAESVFASASPEIRRAPPQTRDG